jgi:hypothetical protein
LVVPVDAVLLKTPVDALIVPTVVGVLLQVPPETESLNVADELIQTEGGPVITAGEMLVVQVAVDGDPQPVL